MNTRDNFPSMQRGAHAWYPEDVRDTSQWLIKLSGEQIADLDAAVNAWQANRLEFADASPQTFPLPSWRELVAEARAKLVDGRGFVMLRGLPVERYTYEQSSIAYWGIGAHFGRGVTQSGNADLLCDITDRGELKHKLDRTYATTRKTDFHCDFADLVGLLCIRGAKAGGASQIASAATVYNCILEERPDLLPSLMEGFVWDRRNEHGEDESPVGPRFPVFTLIKGRVHCRYARGYLMAAIKRLGLELSKQEQEAMDIVTEMASHPRVALSMDFQPGDIQLLNNYLVLHARTDYEDYPEPERKRLLLRLWLEDDAFRYVNHFPQVRYSTLRFGRIGLDAKELREIQRQ